MSSDTAEERDSVALRHLVEAALSAHSRRRALAQEADDGSEEFVDFTDKEIQDMVRALWAERDTSCRKGFHSAVGEAVVRWVSE